MSHKSKSNLIGWNRGNYRLYAAEYNAKFKDQKPTPRPQSVIDKVDQLFDLMGHDAFYAWKNKNNFWGLSDEDYLKALNAKIETLQ